MNNFFSIICFSIVVEALVTYAKTLIVDKKVQWQIIVAMALGILVSIGYRLDIFEQFGMLPSIPYLGWTLTGILISRGSNYIFDLIGQITKLRCNGNQ